MSATAYAMLESEVLNSALEDGIPISPRLYIYAWLAQLAETESVGDPGTAAFLDEGSQLDSRYRTMEAAALRLQKEAKGYLDSLRGMLVYLTTEITPFQNGD